MTTAKTPPGICVSQTLHFIGVVPLLALVWLAWTSLGEPFPAAFWIAIAFPVIHQVFVWLAWRLEIRSSAISKTIGFRGYLACFFLLFGGRFIALFVLAWMARLPG